MPEGALPVDVVVIGAGQAGLSTAYHLRRLGFAPGHGYVVLDGADGPGGAWRHRWPSLTLGRAHGVHDLPGLALHEAVPDVDDPERPAAEVVAAYFGAYERRFDLAVARPVRVRSVRTRPDGRLAVRTDAGDWVARALVNATGTWEKPFWPAYPGRETFRGRQLHTADYRSRDELAGQHVVVVGAGTSAVQLLMEISEVTSTTWVSRHPPRWRETKFNPELGREAVALVERAVAAGRPPSSVVAVTGLPMTAAIRAARARGVLDRLPMFDRIVPDGVQWDGGRHVRAQVLLWCTGFRAALDHLAALGLREPGGGITMVGTRTARDPRVHLVGYGPSASTIGANRAGRASAVGVRDLLGAPTGQTGHTG